jgi:hypothetical protein
MPREIRIPQNPFIVNPRIVSKGSKVQRMSAFLAPCLEWEFFERKGTSEERRGTDVNLGIVLRSSRSSSGLEVYAEGMKNKLLHN